MIITDSVEGSEEDILVAGEHRGGDSSGGGGGLFPFLSSTG